MGQNAFKPIDVLQDRRVYPRRKFLLSGVIAGTRGENPVDTMIRDRSRSGAQVSVPIAIEPGTELYLLDTRVEVANLCIVAWSSPSRAGLSFARHYLLEGTLPPELEFLNRLLIEAKLRQVTALLDQGGRPEDATRTIGVTAKYLERFAQLGRSDDQIALRLDEAKRLFS